MKKYFFIFLINLFPFFCFSQNSNIEIGIGTKYTMTPIPLRYSVPSFFVGQVSENFDELSDKHLSGFDFFISEKIKITDKYSLLLEQCGTHRYWHTKLTSDRPPKDVKRTFFGFTTELCRRINNPNKKTRWDVLLGFGVSGINTGYLDSLYMFYLNGRPITMGTKKNYTFFTVNTGIIFSRPMYYAHFKVKYNYDNPTFDLKSIMLIEFGLAYKLPLHKKEQE